MQIPLPLRGFAPSHGLVLRPQELALRRQDHRAAVVADRSAERHGLDPQRYLTGILARLPGASPSDLSQFLPDVWEHADVGVAATI